MELHGGSTLRRGGGGGRSKTSKTINPLAVYDYALRCAILASLEDSRQSQKADEAQKSRQDRHSTVHLGDVLGNITERFSEESKPDKLTKEIVRGLLKRIDDIIKGKDTTRHEYHDPKFITSLTLFQRPLQLQKSRPMGTINDLVIIFLKTSEVELKKDNPNPAVWGEHLTQYIACFSDLLKKTIQEDAPSSASPELLQALSTFSGPKSARSNSGNKRSTIVNSPNPSSGSGIESLENAPMVQTVQHLFQVSEKDHRKKLRELQPICTESALLVDLKKCINNVHTNQPFPGRREDFPSSSVWDNWQKREVKQLTELMKSMMLMNPNLSLGSETDVGSSNLLASGRRPYSGDAHHRRSSDVSEHRMSMYGSNGLDTHEPPTSPRPDVPQSSFTFIPNDPRSYFKLLLNMCIDFDNNVVPDSERAKTKVLSTQSDDLLKECWMRWRLSAPYRSILYLETVKSRFDNGELEFDDVKDAIKGVDKVLKEVDISSWAINDRESLVRVFEGLNHTILRTLADSVSEYWKINPDWIDDLATMLERIYENPVYAEDHPNPYRELEQIDEIVEGAAVTRWAEIVNVTYDKQSDDLTNLLNLADKLSKELTAVAKKFKGPIMDRLFLPGIVMTKQMPYFALEIENWAHSPDVHTVPIKVIFDLYHKVLKLKNLYDRFGPSKKAALFKVESWFLLHVRRWLKTTDAETPEWVNNAIVQDQFQRINETTEHSSSVVDLFSMFHQAVDFVQGLEWPNDNQYFRFMTVLSKVIGKALEQYTTTLETMFSADMYPRTEAESQLSYGVSFYNRARSQLIGGRMRKDSEPFDFTAQMCVKLNDIEAARSRLDKLYQIMEADEIANALRESGITTAEKVEQSNFLYSIKVVMAENLKPMDANGLSDPYVVLEIDGKQVAKTRTVYETLNPRWDQIFDIPLNNQTVEVLALVLDEDVLGADEDCGAAWFKLSPQYFDDYQTHEIILNLDTQGKIVLRISMEGEKDDIQFWFGKAFRTLKRAENDTGRLIVERMSGFIHQCLSDKVMAKLLGRERGLFSAFKSSTKPIEPTLQDCEESLAPLLDYFEKNLKTLNENLSETAMQLVVLKIWKEILLKLEGLLLPPLSDQPSDKKPLDEYEIHVVFKWLELLKVLFNGGEDGDAVPIDKLENSQYYALLAINASYNMETETLIYEYQNVLRNQGDMKTRGGRKADRSKTVYHSRHTIKQKRRPPSTKRTVAHDMPSSETILRILRMRPGKHVRDFIHAEFEKRNHPPPPPASQQAASDDQHLLPMLPDAMLTPSDESMQRLS
ncbi:hypothetical protein INT44_008690 [Umbelopsis vinacea]|uniref:Uncharacterized protein n=1 Tax=Umbelopsis vinacea TaxID=44442 RepID=A0A8H7PWE7_9FUNG|nr:hypothetical protein INT44_008690 [Umbelopsis vinacea]KAI9288721.1 hypothetical protein BC943DRAFT_357577 [Umbelopsis sp. AD052]